MTTLTMRAVVLLLMPAVAYGWGADGHRIVGEIGTHYLSPAAKANVKALLGNKSLADVSTWADEIRGNPKYRWASPLHYANVQPEASAPASPVTPPEPAHYVGSRRSGVYHYPTCPVVNRIKASNLVEYESAPSGKRLHKGCRP